MSEQNLLLLTNSDDSKRRTLEADSRDSYGFAVRPQHLQRYREYGSIYKEEEEERSGKWKNFLQQCSESVQCKLTEEHLKTSEEDVATEDTEAVSEIHFEGDNSSSENSTSVGCKEREIEKEVPRSNETKRHNIRTWASLAPSLAPIETMMCVRVKNKVSVPNDPVSLGRKHLSPVCEEMPESENLENICHTDSMLNSSLQEKATSADGALNIVDGLVTTESFFPWKEELESLVHGGVPKSLRGEVWQAFVSVRERRVDRYYQKMLSVGMDSSDGKYPSSIASKGPSACSPEKLRIQIEKDLPRTFPGHPALDEEGRNSLRRILTAYAYHNPSVGYCQAMNFFAGLFLLLMPEENAFCLLIATKNEDPTVLLPIIGRLFSLCTLLASEQKYSQFVGGNYLRETELRTINLSLFTQTLPEYDVEDLLRGLPGRLRFDRMLVGIIDDYFDGYYTHEMIESQVDQLVFEELMRERFPKLVNHLDYLGVEVAWVSGPWFLSIFMNMLPWESVLRVWDVILFEGNRVMLFRTALALMELYGPALVTTQDAADAISLLQSLTGSTFDSSQLVFTACMGFLGVTEARLKELREKHRPSVLGIIEDRTKGSEVSKESKSLASKLYSFKQDAQLLIKEPDTTVGLSEKLIDSVRSEANSPSNFDEFMCALSTETEFDSSQDHQEQVVWLKVELCRLMEENRSATLRAEELETAFLEIAKEDNRRELSARVEQLEQEVSVLRRALADKQEQEHAMLQVLMRVEQEQKFAEDARIAAEQEVAVQKNTVYALQEKYKKAMVSIAEKEKRVVMAESMLQATLQYESGQAKAQSSPRAAPSDSPRGGRRTGLLSFGLGWRDKNKGKAANEEQQGENRLARNNSEEEAK